ncbi:MAG TPA: hypothetical protein DCQ50_21045 [Chryseobacterium sp.]|nr:hypothetical protein [Chryseobacterium sp.]
MALVTSICYQTQGNNYTLPYFNSASFSGVFNSSGQITAQRISEQNFAFIDGQNLYMGLKENGWKADWYSFRKYLSEKCNVTKAIFFLGYIQENEWLYELMERAGFTLEFTPTRILPNGQLDGGNVDALLASYMMDCKNEYSKAVLVADDSDYCPALESLKRQNKLKLIISSHPLESTSQWIQQIADTNTLISIHSLRNELEYIKQ